MKTVLLVSSDAGGTIALLPVVHELLARGLSVHIVASGPAIQIWQGEEVPCSRDSLPDTISEVEAVSLIRQHSTDAVLSGAGAYNQIEHTFRRAAAQLGVFCFALVDGWFNFSVRFQREDNGLVTSSLPDLIGVLDEASVNEMLEEGFDANKIVIVGAPHFEETVRFAASVSEADLKHLCTRFGFQGDRHIFVFFSTPVESGGGHDGRGMPDLGYTEASILSEIVQRLSEACTKCGRPAQLVVKPHPSESSSALSGALKATKRSDLLQCQIIEECKSKELICLADGVLGMTSSALLEAALCGKPVFSIQIGRNHSAHPDRYFGNRKGITPVYDSDLCRHVMWRLLHTPRRPRTYSLSSDSNQAASRVVQALLANIAGKPTINTSV